jgi:hypothetical protein
MSCAVSPKKSSQAAMNFAYSIADITDTRRISIQIGRIRFLPLSLNDAFPFKLGAFEIQQESQIATGLKLIGTLHRASDDGPAEFIVNQFAHLLNPRNPRLKFTNALFRTADYPARLRRNRSLTADDTDNADGQRIHKE